MFELKQARHATHWLHPEALKQAGIVSALGGWLLMPQTQSLFLGVMLGHRGAGCVATLAPRDE